MHEAPKKSFGIFFLIGKIDKRWYEIKFSCKEILLKFTINYSLFMLNYNWQHCSAISLTVIMLCVCTKRVCMCNYELVCKAVWLAFSCQTSAISLPFILICWAKYAALLYTRNLLFKSNESWMPLEKFLICINVALKFCKKLPICRMAS